MQFYLIQKCINRAEQNSDRGMHEYNEKQRTNKQTEKEKKKNYRIWKKKVTGRKE